MKPVATIVLNRNLPDITDKLCDHLVRFDGDLTDIYVVEAGSDPYNLSKYCTWHVQSEDAISNGLRYGRGMNFGLSQLYDSGQFDRYEAFFLITNDTELEPKVSIQSLLGILRNHPRVGILSPCSRKWGERLLFHDLSTKYFWFIHNNAFLLRREFISVLCNPSKGSSFGFLFDENNFRGYCSELELIAKAYANDWAAAITTEVWANENESYLIGCADAIRTEPYERNLELYVKEGKAWMKEKYGFSSHWTMQHYAKFFYDKFFEFHPEFLHYKI